MIWFRKRGEERLKSPLIQRYVGFWSSIYGRVIFIFCLSSIFLFFTFWIIFRSVNEGYLKSVIHENGNQIALLVEGALYESMLENDRTSLQSTLDIINTMSGIDDVNMYDKENNLAYSSISTDTSSHSDPECKNCHSDISTMFSATEKSYRIIDVKSECSMNHHANNSRHLLVKSPILNSPSCYTSACHAHSPDDKVLGSLFIKLPLRELDAAMDKARKDYSILAIIVTAFLVSVLIALTTQHIRKPLNALISVSESVAKGDRSTRVKIKPGQPSDMRMVSAAFNNMLDNLQKTSIELQNWSQQLEYKVQKKTEELGHAQHELINIERIASLGRLSMSVAHEINNPLSGILIYAKLIQKQLNNQDIDPKRKEAMLKHLRFIETEAVRCGDIVKGLLDFSRKGQDDFEPAHLNEILLDTCDLMNHSMKMANIHFLYDFSASPDMIFCNRNQVKQVCVAILVNAREAVSENGEILLRTNNPDPDHIRIDFVDNGTGISDQDLPHIFEPFFSTKEKAKGIGLGLAIVHGIVQNHKGRIDVKSEREKGTTFSVTFSLIKT